MWLSVVLPESARGIYWSWRQNLFTETQIYIKFKSSVRKIYIIRTSFPFLLKQEGINVALGVPNRTRTQKKQTNTLFSPGQKPLPTLYWVFLGKGKT